MEFVVIAVHMRDGDILGFRIMNTGTGEVSNVGYQKMIQAVSGGRATFTNIEVKNDVIVGSNGDLSRYPVLIGEQLHGKSPLIILMEVSGDKYRVVNYLGEVVDMDNTVAVRYSESEGIANGKVVTRENGMKFISSIRGEYPKDEVLQDKGRAEHLRNKSLVLGVKDYGIDEDFGLVMKNTKIEEMEIPSGVLKLKNGAFKGCHSLKRVLIPPTVEVIEAGAFEACRELEEVVLPEGLRELKKGTFRSCAKLKKVVFPNSLRTIESGVFFNCRGLKVVECGPNGIDNPAVVLPRGVRLVRRGR